LRPLEGLLPDLGVEPEPPNFIAASRTRQTAGDCVGSWLKRLIFWSKTIAADVAFTGANVLAPFTTDCRYIATVPFVCWEWNSGHC